MKYIKIFEDFGKNLNEALKETTLPGGFIHRNVGVFPDDIEQLENKKNNIYWDTDTSSDGSPGALTIVSSDGKVEKKLSFAHNGMGTEDRTIGFLENDFDNIRSTGKVSKPTVLAKTPEEAYVNAFTILGYGTRVTPTPGDPKVLGDMLRSFFEIRKMYPDYLNKNPLLKQFMQGIISQYNKPNWGFLTGMSEFKQNIDSDNYKDEIVKVLSEYGVIKPTK